MKILKTILAMCLFSVMGAYAAMPSQKTVKVATAEGLLRALESNQRIVISEGVQIMLTPTISDDALCKLMDINEINTYDATPEPYEKKTAIGYYDNFDGRQLVVGGFKNLTIEGEGKGASIIVSPRYAYILFFLGGKDITLRNLTLGHTEEGYCEGGVLYFYGTENVTIEQCDMYGCGTEGIGAKEVTNMRCNNSIIRECSYQIMTLEGCNNVTFDACDFYKNKEFSLVNIGGSKGVKFSNCSFHENRGPLFNIGGERVAFVECSIEHDEDMLGDVSMINDTGSRWLDVKTVTADDGDDYGENNVDTPEDVNYLDTDWDEKRPLVPADQPGIVDFFEAVAHKSNSPLIRNGINAIKSPGSATDVDVVEVDRANGYIIVGNSPATHNANDYKAVEACYWKMGGGKCVVAVNHLLPDNSTVLNFYNYDPRTRLLSPLYINPNDNLEAPVIYALPRVGKSIQMLNPDHVNRQVATFTFDGQQFTFMKTNTNSVSMGKSSNAYGITDMVSFIKRLYPKF